MPGKGELEGRRSFPVEASARRQRGAKEKAGRFQHPQDSCSSGIPAAPGPGLFSFAHMGGDGAQNPSSTQRGRAAPSDKADTLVPLGALRDRLHDGPSLSRLWGRAVERTLQKIRRLGASCGPWQWCSYHQEKIE